MAHTLRVELMLLVTGLSWKKASCRASCEFGFILQIETRSGWAPGARGWLQEATGTRLLPGDRGIGHRGAGIGG